MYLCRWKQQPKFYTMEPDEMEPDTMEPDAVLVTKTLAGVYKITSPSNQIC